MIQTPIAIKIENLCYRIKSKNILQNLNFQVKYGKIVGLIGPNGSGKSTLIKLITGIISPSSGRILIKNIPIKKLSKLNAAKLRAIVTQEFNINFNFTVQDILEMGQFPWKNEYSTFEKSQQLKKIIANLNLENFLNQPYIYLSGGEKQRVNFARALAQNTDILILDEPTAAMDIFYQEQIMSTIKAQANQGKAVLLVVHDLSLAATYCDEIVLIHQGKNVAQGKPSQVFQPDILTQIYQHPIKVLTDTADDKLIILPKR